MITAVTTPLKILAKPRANYSDEAKNAQVQGTVILRITLLATGKVGDITPLTRLPYGLTEQAIAAAKQITFEPKKVNGIPFSVVKTIEYSFSSGGSEPSFTDNTDLYTERTSVESSPETSRQVLLKSKLHMWLYALLTRLASNNSTPAENESQFVRDGKASIEIQLTAISDGVRAKLKAAGFEIVSEKGKTKLSGRISIDKLASLADIDEVKLILPLING